MRKAQVSEGGRGYSVPSRRAMLAEMVLSQIGGDKPEKPIIGRVEPRNDIELIVSQIEQNTGILAQRYGEYLPGKTPELQEAMYSTLTDLAYRLQKETRGKDDDVMVNGLNELDLLVRVDALFAQGDQDTIQILQVINTAHDKKVLANLADLQLVIQEKDNVRLFVPESATWSFEPNGIRLEIVSKDETTGEVHIIRSGMDCHHRPVKAQRQGLSQDRVDESALDVHGHYLDPALRNLGKNGDYHRSEFLDPVLNKSDFRTISDFRWLDVLEHYSRDKVLDRDYLH